MLRAFVVVLGLAMLLGAAAAAMCSNAGASLWLLAVGGSLTIGTVFERIVYKRVVPQSPGQGWTRTGERFVDPESEETVEVFFNAASGERRYVGTPNR